MWNIWWSDGDRVTGLQALLSSNINLVRDDVRRWSNNSAKTTWQSQYSYPITFKQYVVRWPRPPPLAPADCRAEVQRWRKDGQRRFIVPWCPARSCPARPCPARSSLLLGQRQNSRLLGVSRDPAPRGLPAAALHATNCRQARPVELGDDWTNRLHSVYCFDRVSKCR